MARPEKVLVGEISGDFRSYDMVEAWDIFRRARRGLSWKEFEIAWRDFHIEKDGRLERGLVN